MPFPVRKTTITIDGKTYEGTYYVQRLMVHVQSPFGSKARRVERPGPEVMARLLLWELVRESQKA